METLTQINPPEKRGRGRPPKLNNQITTQPVAKPMVVNIEDIVVDEPSTKETPFDVVKRMAEYTRQTSNSILTKDQQVWLLAFAAIVGTFNSAGNVTVSCAMNTADYALKEFKRRFPE